MNEHGSYPNTRETIDALPYMPHWGHWSITAWDLAIKQNPPVYRKLAEVFFPVGAAGPQAPHDVKCRKFAELDAAARDALNAHEHACPTNYFARGQCDCASILPRLVSEERDTLIRAATGSAA